MDNTALRELQEADKAFHLHPFTHHPEMHAQGTHVIVSGQGCYLTDATGRRWALESLAGNRAEGSHLIQVAFSGRTADLDERTFQITSEFTLRGVAVVSQRVQGTGCGGQVFQYELSGGARKVELLILSVSGRRIASLDLPRQAGYNVYCWDGRDGQGHEAATGVYFYRVKATDPSGRTLTRDGRMIRSR